MFHFEYMQIPMSISSHKIRPNVLDHAWFTALGFPAIVAA